MNSRQTDTVTRVDIRLPNHLYSQIQSIAINHFNAKIHHRSNKPEVSPTILELIQIGIAHIESNLPVSDEVSEGKVADDLRRQIKQLDARLSEVESLLLRGQSHSIEVAPQIPSGEGLTDSELSKVLSLSSALIYRYRRDGQANRGVVERLKDWQVQGDRWFEK
ncbi:MAG: hypothetical protein ACRC8K_09640 [Waterburya sp.]